MATQAAHQVVEPSTLKIEIHPDLLEELDKVDRATKRLSLPEKCPTCGQHIPGPSRSPFRNSHQSAKSARDFVEIPLAEEPEQFEIEMEKRPARGVRFWSIIVALTVVGAVAALEGTIVGTVLPTIVDDLGGAQLYIWTVNGYFLTSMVFQPLVGQMANIFGRKSLMMISITFFVIGSAICGAAQNMKMLIAGRAVQGSGAGGMNMLAHVIVSDIVPLRERSSFMSIIYLFIAASTGVGPIVGGLIVEKSNWRWVFLLNIPVGCLALLLVGVFLQVKHVNSNATTSDKLKRIDYIGNFIFIPSVVSILLALVWGGTIYSWSSWKVVLPIIIGFVGLGLFLAFEWSKYCVEPTMPRRLFTNRTTVAALFVSMIYSMMLYWLLYWSVSPGRNASTSLKTKVAWTIALTLTLSRLPIYFQAVLESSPVRAGVQLLPFVFVLTPFGAIAGRALSKCGRYRLIHHIAFVLLMIGLGLLSTLGSESTTASWACFQILVAAGSGLLTTTVLPAVQAPLDDSDTATATGTWAFLRSLGTVLAVPIPATIFNNQVDNLASRISNPLVRKMLMNGNAYEHATSAFLTLFHGELKAEIISVYSDSLKLVWQVAIGIASLGLLITCVEKEIGLRSDLKTDYGLEEKRKKEKSYSEGVPEA